MEKKKKFFGVTPAIKNEANKASGIEINNKAVIIAVRAAICFGVCFAIKGAIRVNSCSSSHVTYAVPPKFIVVVPKVHNIPKTMLT